MTFPFTPARPLWLLGCGNMAGAMLQRWLDCGLDPASVTIIDPHRTQSIGAIKLAVSAPVDGPAPAAVMIGVKPQSFVSAIGTITGHVNHDTLVISIMAGIDLASLNRAIPQTRNIVRLMPNLPVALGKGVALLFGDISSPARNIADTLAAPLGLALWVEREALIDAGTAVSGSGPAFVYRFIDAVAQGAERLGFTADQAQKLALAMVEGAALLAAQSPDTPAQLADRVASPGGTTRAGLDILDKDNALTELIAECLQAAADRAAELAKLAEKT